MTQSTANRLDLVERLQQTPLITPADVIPSRSDMQVDCVLNPGAFRYQGRVALLLRIAESAQAAEHEIAIPIMDPSSDGGLRILRVQRDDPLLEAGDPRAVTYDGHVYLTTLSHLRLAWSDDDGRSFTVEPKPFLCGDSVDGSYGIEDARVVQVAGEDKWRIHFTTVSPTGVCIGEATTRDWKSAQHTGILFPPHNKDLAWFERRINGEHWCLHRPSGLGLGGNNIWIARSPDGEFWGKHKVLAASRAGMWDEERVGAGCAPIETDQGWLAIYHGCDAKGCYRLGALLLDLQDPSIVLARSVTPIMEPSLPFEQEGFFSQCVFTNGHVVDGDRVRLYYGAADTVVGAGDISIAAILERLEREQ